MTYGTGGGNSSGRDSNVGSDLQELLMTIEQCWPFDVKTYPEMRVSMAFNTGFFRFSTSYCTS